MTNRPSALVPGTHFGKFVSVGTVGAVLDLSLSSLLIVLFGVANELTKPVSAELTIVITFVINDRWAFVGVGPDLFTTEIRRFAKSSFAQGGGFLVQVLVVRALGKVSLSIPVAGVDL